MNISKRINTLVNFIENDSLADIGTDHGYIALHAHNKKKLKKIIACDINKEPLNNCKNNLQKHNLENVIETRLGSGVSKIEIAEVETAIIAGMGGNLIVDILKENLEISKSFKQLILQPQASVANVRRFIHEIDFSILNEKIIFEDGRYYFILNCINKKEEPYTDFQYDFGKLLLEEKNSLYKDYLLIELEKKMYVNSNIIDNAIQADKYTLKKIKGMLGMYKADEDKDESELRKIESMTEDLDNSLSKNEESFNKIKVIILNLKAAITILNGDSNVISLENFRK